MVNLRASDMENMTRDNKHTLSLSRVNRFFAEAVGHAKHGKARELGTPEIYYGEQDSSTRCTHATDQKMWLSIPI